MIIGNTAGFTRAAEWRQLTGAGTRNWRGVDMSANGQYMVAVDYGGYIYVSSDYGQTWTAKHTTSNWTGVSMSADGSVIVVTTSSSPMYVQKSLDYGATWANVAGSSGQSVACKLSPNGNVGIFAGDFSIKYNYKLYTSLRSSDTYTSTTNYAALPLSCAANDSLFVYGGLSTIYTKTLSGSPVARSGAGTQDWRGLAVTPDSQKIFAGVGGTSGGYIYRSVDGGVNWTELTSVGSQVWLTCATSDDGQTVAASPRATNGQLHLSLDGGTTWAAQPGAGTAAADYYACAVSPDGSRVLAAPYGGYIYIRE